MKEKIKKIIWISGRCGYGKTSFANSIVKEFERKGKKTCKLDCQDFVDILVRNLRNKAPLDSMICYFRGYDLLVLDDVDLSLSGKTATQKEIKKVIQGITANNTTEVILIAQKRARKLRKLKFDSDICFYKRLKAPTVEFKRNLFKRWIEWENLILSKGKIEEIINKSDNLFQLKGLFNKVKFIDLGCSSKFI
ncbi:hypothetical protein CO121_01320 [bacterium (Candidatus Gribaldobacteria) CG_4_9_14_3_um_filter_36_15]|uniref:Chromosomal replication initiator protein DnaA ATPAse domain-containing protein n=2 Tax=Candidatus Gribaldobacteria TaxID=2798536 RepID=A0A2M7ZV61_9BACT|nr:MAG: hypothetical protein CO121_01320 [bacterium (Candidatus Gribaldobacteria) CG_4_9_14_3_um_filter_36_15]